MELNVDKNFQFLIKEKLIISGMFVCVFLCVECFSPCISIPWCVRTCKLLL